MDKKKLFELKKYFRGLGLTQAQIAEKLGVSQSYVATILSGSQELGKKNAQKWGEILNVSPTWLLTGEGQMLLNQPQSEEQTHTPLKERMSLCNDLIDKVNKLLDTIINQQNMINELQQSISRLQKTIYDQNLMINNLKVYSEE